MVLRGTRRPLTGISHFTSPHPPCLQSCSSIKHLPLLQLQAAAGLDGNSLGNWEGPPAWIAGVRRAVADPCVLNWVVDEAGLVMVLSGKLENLVSPLAYCNGAFFRCGLSFVQAEGGVDFALGVRYEGAEVARIARSANALMPEHKRVAVVNARVSVLGDDGSWSFHSEFRDKMCSAASTSWIRSKIFYVPEGSCTTEAEAAVLLSPFMCHGCISLSIRVELDAR